MAVEENSDRSYELFKRQRDSFLSELLRAEPDIAVFPDQDDARAPGDWAVLFAPKSWGSFEGGHPGVRFAFSRFLDPNTLNDYARLSVDVEAPLAESSREPFKVDLLAKLRSRGIQLRGFTLWPHAGVGVAREVIETRILLDSNAAREALRRYRQLAGFIAAATDVIRRYDERGCFTGRLQFDES
ncbi:MAG: hypothetical protein LLF99_02700 [Desulfobacteraceae bacterium]|nr:hypothetical protein [Desulfobacteraceae bacterium]